MNIATNVQNCPDKLRNWVMSSIARVDLAVMFDITLLMSV